MSRYGQLTSTVTLWRTQRDIKQTFAKWGIKDFDIRLGLRDAEVLFTVNGARQTLRCDRFDDAPTNLRAIYLVLEPTRLAAQRGILEELAAVAMAMLPAGKVKRPAHVVLGVAEDTPLEIAEAAYKLLARQHHPDAGGDPQKMIELNDAIEQFRQRRNDGHST